MQSILTVRWTRFSCILIISGLISTCMSVATGTAQDSPQKVFAQSFQKLVVDKDIDGAMKLIDENTELKPEALAQFRIQLGSLLMRDKRTDEAVSQFNQALEATFSKLEDGSNPNLFAAMLPNAAMMLRQAQPEQADQWIGKGLMALEGKLGAEKLSDNHRIFGQIMRMKLNTPDSQAAESAKGKLLEFVANCEKIYAAEPDPSVNAKTMIDLWNDLLSVMDEENAPQLFDKIQALAQSQLKNSPSSAVLATYTAAVSNVVSGNARTNPDLASETLRSAIAYIEAIESDDTNFNRVRENFIKNAGRMEKSIESGRAILAMIGNPAPAIDAMEWLNGDPETSDSLKGKVVLLDFWAVWCGPCIATFPHLKHLDAEYGSKGLTIVGVTRQYNYQWDEASSKAIRATEPVSLEDEMAMLEKFIASHQLTHRNVVTPQESKMQSEYHVTGIPHVALLDKQGNVRLVKIGSGKKNADEIEAMIKKLLVE